MRFKANSCKCLGQNMYQAQQLTANVMLGQVCPDKYNSTPMTLLQLKATLAELPLISFTKGLDSDGVYFPLAHPSSKPSASITHLISPVCFILRKPVSGSHSNVTPRKPVASSSCSRSMPSSCNCMLSY